MNMKTLATIVAFAGFAAMAAPAPAATYYVATNGSDSAAGSTSAPFATIGRGLTRMASGDTLIVRNGTYSGNSNFINDGISAIPSGTASAPTTIRAENPYGVRIQNSGSTAYYDSPLRIRGTYVTVDGFIFDLRDQTYTPYVGEISGTRNRIMRSIFRRQGAVDDYGGWVYVGGTYQLLEDVAGVGAARYGFQLGGPSGSSHHLIFRRVVGRFDFSSSTQPKATFNAYGNNDGFGVHSILYQNCIALDGQQGPTSGQPTYGAWYFPKNMDNGRIVGSIALNNDVYYAGMFVQEELGKNTYLENSVAWQNGGDAEIRGNGAGPMTMSRMTIGSTNGGTGISDRNGVGRVTSSLFSGLTQPASGSTVSGSAFWPTSAAMGSNIVSMGANILYLPDASRGTGLSNVGAVLTKRVGRSGTFWDDPGYDEVTTENLWPFPNESHIKAVFSEPNTPRSGNTPSTNNTVRGFTVASDAFGKSMTLTRYVWQFLGNEIPADIYNAKTPDPPTAVTAQ